MPITREQMIEQSLQSFIAAELVVRGYATSDVEVLDAFPFERMEEPLGKTYVATGFNFDDGGSQAELGSTLVIRTHTLEFFTFSYEITWAKNVAQEIKSIIESGTTLDIFDYRQPGDPPPLLDRLELLLPGGVRVERVPVRDPRPWERYVHLTRVKVRDEYYAVED